MSSIRMKPLITTERRTEAPESRLAGKSTNWPVASHGSSPLNSALHEIERLLTTKEVSEILKVHPKVLERMAKRGEVPALKVGKFWRYRATTLDAWINSRLQSERQPCRMKTSF